MAENIIFYGPPGTGKTYLLQKMMSDYLDYEVSDKQILDAYVSMSNDWVLITMILLQHHGKMKASDIQQKINNLNVKTTVNATAVLEAHSMNNILPGITRTPPCVFFEEDSEWYVDRVRVQQAYPQFFEKFLADSKTDCRYAFVTFHQSFSYEDFVEGIRPEYDEKNNTVDYSPKPGVFKSICAEAREHKEKQYAVFIDEINRGNISEILGELISLIEVDKRQGMANELSVTLPYSKSVFVVPQNLNIYGTMNSADRSVGAIDIALRRRFKFIPLMPDSASIEKELLMNGVNPNNIDGIDVIRLFNTMNNRIELLLDRNHLLGQALFLKVRNGSDLVEAVRDKVVPLLEEYFFNDLQKVQLIFADLDENGNLRSDAIYKHEELYIDDHFEYFGDYLLDDKKHYFINDSIGVEDLKHIYE